MRKNNKVPKIIDIDFVKVVNTTVPHYTAREMQSSRDKDKLCLELLNKCISEDADESLYGFNSTKSQSLPGEETYAECWFMIKTPQPIRVTIKVHTSYIDAYAEHIAGSDPKSSRLLYIGGIEKYFMHKYRGKNIVYHNFEGILYTKIKNYIVFHNTTIMIED